MAGVLPDDVNQKVVRHGIWAPSGWRLSRAKNSTPDGPAYVYAHRDNPPSHVRLGLLYPAQIETLKEVIGAKE